MDKRNLMINLFKSADFKFDNNIINRFLLYYEMIIETNKYINLTAITDFEEVVVKHFIDSLSIVQCNNIDNVNNIIDIGTGAGFPGIPLKIAFPEIHVTLVDSLNKRVNFLKDVIDELQLTEIEALHSRAEDLGRNKDYREQFDLAVSRAVANLATLSEYCIPFVKVGGKFISYKAKNISDEVHGAENAINVLGGKVSSVKKLLLAHDNMERSFVVIDKLAPTDNNYPRKSGLPKNRPI